MNKKRPKIFCIGMFKTGTTTMGRLFEQMGYKSFNGPDWRFENDHFEPSYQRFMEQKELIDEIIAQYDTFQDWPAMYLYPYFDEVCEGAKFIYTYRDAAAVAKSDMNMWGTMGKDKKTIPDAQKFIDRYEAHEKAVLTYFDGHKNFLKVKVGDPKDIKRIYDFLEIPLPADAAWPVANKGNYGIYGMMKKSRFLRKLQRAILKG